MQNLFKYAVHNRGVEGKKREKTLLDWIIVIAFFFALALIVVYLAQNWFIRGAEAKDDKGYPEQVYNFPPPCTLDAVECEGEIKEPIKQVRYEEVYITYYSKADSCHYPKGEGCLTSSGKIAQIGFIACPRSLLLGTKVIVNNSEYICEDRYAKWVDDNRDLPTIDIWTDKESDWARKQGLQKATVEIID